MSRRRANQTGRSNGKRFVMVEHWVLNTPAWQVISSHAKVVLIHLLKRFNGVNNGEIAFAVRQGEEAGLSRSVTARAINELIDVGFVIVRRDSAFTVKTRDAREFELTLFECNGRQPCKDFARYRPEPIANLAKAKGQSEQRDAKAHHWDTKGATEPEQKSEGPHAGPQISLKRKQQSPQTATSSYAMPRTAKPNARSTCEASKAKSHQGRRPANQGADIIDLTDRLAVHAPVDQDRLRSRMGQIVKHHPRGTQAKLGREIGLSPEALSNFRAGRFRLSEEKANALLQALDAFDSALVGALTVRPSQRNEY